VRCGDNPGVSEIVGAERARTAGFGRLELGLRQASDWYLWGPYLSEQAREAALAPP